MFLIYTINKMLSLIVKTFIIMPSCKVKYFLQYKMFTRKFDGAFDRFRLRTGTKSKILILDLSIVMMTTDFTK